MTTFKKILSVVLALAMVLGMTAVAFADEEAAPAEDLVIAPAPAEAEDIVIAPAPVEEYITYREAVDVLKALEILVGDENGMINPQNELTRGQATKLVAYLMLGDAEAEKLEAKETFADVPVLEWDASYIAYCAESGIVNGYDAATFAPKDAVTGVQFGKMILGCLGYKAELEGLVGEGWDNATALLMKEAGLTEGVVTLVGPLTREEAAQICLNAIKATMVEYVGESTEATPVAVAKNVKETIYNDDKLQLGEKLFAKLTLKEGKEEHTWSLDGKEIGKYANAEVVKPEEPVVDENAPEINEKRTYPLIGQERLLANPEVLFSKDGKTYTSVLLAHPGEKIFVKANRFTLDLIKMFNGTLPELVVSNTEKAYDAESLVDFYNIFNWVDWAQLYADNLQQFNINTLKFFGKVFKKDYTIELNLVEEKDADGNVVAPANGKAATYYFYMPDRWVTTKDFETASIQTVTFFNRTLTKRTLYVKSGDLNKVQKVEVAPFKTAKVEAVAGEKLVYTSLARPTQLFKAENRRFNIIYSLSNFNADQLFILKSNLAWF